MGSKKKRNKNKSGASSSSPHKRSRMEETAAGSSSTDMATPSEAGGTAGSEEVTEVAENCGVQHPIDPNSRLFTCEHPMLNPLLITKIFSFYNPDIEDFKILRQVCKCWLDVTFELWRKRFILRLTEEPEVFRERKGPGISVGEFLRRFEDPNDPYQLCVQPYNKYTFSELTIDMDICETAGSECKRFWDNVGPLIEYLHFNRCFFMAGQYMAFDQLVLEKVPNLKTLIITDTGKVGLPTIPNENAFVQRQKAVERMLQMKSRVMEDHHNLKSLQICGGIPVKLRKLISKLPNLEDLRIRNSVHTTASYDDILMDLLIFLRKHRINSQHAKYSLKSLDLMHTRAFYNWFSISRVFANVNFPLETLSVEIKPDQSVNHQALKPLLECHASTLKCLKVFCPPLSNTNYHDTFPFDLTLENVEEFQAWGNVTRSFKFLKFFPNLKRVYINRNCIEKWEEVIMQQKEVSHLGWFHPTHRTYILPFSDDMVQKAEQEGDMSLVRNTQLEVLQVDYQFGADSLRKLGEWCPNVKTLWTVVTNQNVGAIREVWPELNNLIAMFQSDLDDEAITGWRFEGDEKMEKLPGFCLSDLTNLRRFQYDTLCSQSKLTDKAALHGLLHMKRLDAVQICVSAKFSPETDVKLKKNIPLVRVIRNYGRKPHHCDTEASSSSNVGVCCFHKKFFENIRTDEIEHTNRAREMDRARQRRRNRAALMVAGRGRGGDGGARQVEMDIVMPSSSSDDDSSSDSDSSSSSSSSSASVSDHPIPNENESSDDEDAVMPHLERMEAALGFL